MYYVINDFVIDHCMKDNVKDVLQKEDNDYAIPPIKWFGVVKGATMQECAKALGYKTLDYALPDFWVKDVEKLTGQYPVGHFVWCYDDPEKGFGYPAPISVEGTLLLKIFDHIRLQ